MCISTVVNSIVSIKIVYKNKEGEVKEILYPNLYGNVDEETIVKKVVTLALKSIDYEDVEILKIEKEFKQLGGYI